MVSQLNNYTLAPISEERVSEAAGVNSAAGSFGLSFGLAFAGAIMLATLSITFTNMAQASTVLPPAEQQHVAQALEDDAEVMSNTQLEELLVGQPEEIQDEIIRINTDATTPCPSSGTARSAPRRSRRTVQLIPHDATTRPQAIGFRRRAGLGLISHPRDTAAMGIARTGSGKCRTGPAGTQPRRDNRLPRPSGRTSPGSAGRHSRRTLA